MEVKYRADLYANYMLMEIPEDVDFQTYSFKMIDKTNPASKTYTKGSISCLTNAKKGLFFLSLCSSFLPCFNLDNASCSLNPFIEEFKSLITDSTDFSFTLFHQ